jgi:hypothetical protein
VSARLSNVAFPFGKQILNRDVPGATKASMLVALPDVGAGMDTPVSYHCRFVRAGDKVVPDRCDHAVS